MRTFVWGLREEVTILGRRERGGRGRPLSVPHYAAGLQLLTTLCADRRHVDSLRSLLGEESRNVTLCTLSDHEIIEQLAMKLARGELRVETQTPTLPKIPAGAETAASPPAVERKPEKQQSWFEMLLLWADSGEPVPTIAFKIKPPRGSEQEHKTDSHGLIRLDPIKAGDCEIESVTKEATHTNAITAKVGSEPPKDDEPAKKPEKNPPEYKLIELHRYKVKTGDTLDNLAKKVSMPWQELAKFNWGTDDPARINRHLRWDVGCGKKTADGKNYLFDDSDDPGIILLPEPWKLKEKAGRRVVLLISKAEESLPWVFSM